MAYFHLLYFIADWTYRLRTLPLSFLEIFAGFEEYCQRPGLRRHNCWWRGCFGRGLCCSLQGCGCLRRGDCGFSQREGYVYSRRLVGDGLRLSAAGLRLLLAGLRTPVLDKNPRFSKHTTAKTFQNGSAMFL